MSEYKKLTISVLGKSYPISTDEQENDVLQAAELVNVLLKDFLKEGANHLSEKLMMMVALQLAINLVKSQKNMHNYEEKISNLVSLFASEIEL